MAIRFITGVPGSGKTYYAVYHLLKTYFKFDKDIDDYKPLSEFTIFTNIDALSLPHVDINEACKAASIDISQFFTVPYQEKIRKKYPKIVYLIDEAQRFFPYRNKLTAETWFYFEYHRHMGHDIYIITQDRKLVAQNITLLAETEIRACKKTFSFLGEFRYLIKSDGEIIDRFTLRPEKRIFLIYKSFDSEASEKIKNPLKKYILIIATALIILLIYGKTRFFHNGRFTPFPDADANEIQSITKTEAQQKQKKTTRSFVKNDHFTETDYESEKPQIRQLSSIRIDKKIYIHDPVSGNLIPSDLFPRPVTIRRNPGFRSPIITAYFLPSEIPSLSSDGPAQPEQSQTIPGS